MDASERAELFGTANVIPIATRTIESANATRSRRLLMPTTPPCTSWVQIRCRAKEAERALGRGPPPHALLLAIHRAVGSFDQPVDRRLAGRVGHSPGDRGQPVARPDRAAGDLLGKATHDPLGGENRRAAEEHRKLIAADSRNQVAVPNPCLQDCADPHECLVAGRVAKVVIQGLETVRVQDRDGERLGLAGGKLPLQTLEEAPPVWKPGERIGRRGGLGRLMELRDPHGSRDLMRDRGQELLVLAAKGGDARAFDAERPDALIPKLKRDRKDRADLVRPVEARIEAAVRNVLQLATLHDPPADALTPREALTNIRPGRSYRGPDHEVVAAVIEREEEAVLVAHRIADDPEQPLREIVDIENGADLRREPLEDRQLPSVGLSARRELFKEEPRSGHVLDVLVKDPGDAPELGGTLGAVPLDEPQERVDHGGVELGPATAEKLGTRVFDRLRRLVRATAHDDLEGIRGGHDVGLD